TCHQPSNAMSISAEAVRGRWADTHGKDPIFAAVDGSNCPDRPQDVKESHSLLLERGLLRIALSWPPRAADGTAVRPEFRIEVVRDPTGCNTSTIYGIASAKPAISVYRRPRVAANLNYLAGGPGGAKFMSDGREPTLSSQAATAVLVHEQAKEPPAPETLRQIVDFETQIYAAQISNIRGGLLNEKAGPVALGPENLAAGKAGTQAFASFAVWRKPKMEQDPGVQIEFRASVARGSDVFLTRTFRVNEAASTCATCHRQGTTRWMDIGTTNTAAAKASPDLPLFRITCDSSAAPHPLLGRVIYTQDPGRALISGKCADVGSIVMQQFHGLAARAPYFSNGSARTLRELVDFYDRRYAVGYTEREKQDLINFLSVL
ncbi:MAG: hypothetical protein JWO80_3518, partial [Bryobacterales bacterium]|nr:hypothetical protein [Bryobacterales bacterium]